MTPRLSILFLLASVTLSHGATNYVRAGATAGTKGGTNWANAFTNIPISMTRGDTYYVAEGNYGYVGYGGYSYGAYEFNDNVSSTTLITLRKAIATDHGDASDWDNAYGDGQAVFIGGVVFWDGYYVIDGNGRNESNWEDGASYGFRIPSINVDTINGQYGSNLTFRYVDIGGTYSESDSVDYDNPIKAAYSIEGWTLSRCYIHNYGSGYTGIQFAGGGDHVVEYCHFGPGWGKEAIRGQNSLTNTIIRYNVFRDAAQSDDVGNSGLTAEIAIWANGGPFDGIEIYGNVFTNKVTTDVRNGCILLGPFDGNAGFAHSANVYNNTFIGVLDDGEMIGVYGTNAMVKNNLFYNCASSSISVTNGETANNLTVGSNVFSGFAITAALPGTALGSPYNTDLTGATRGADGVFDIGAYEYDAGGGGGGDPAPSGSVWNVTNLRIGQ